MTDKQWNHAIYEIEGLRFQLVNNIMPMSDRDDLKAKLKAKLIALANAPYQQRSK